MQNKSLAKDYIIRCTKRLKAVDVLYEEKSWPDVVRESQEIVELSLKGLLRYFNIEFPRVHDVSGILEQELNLFPEALKVEIPKLIKISRSLRRDRELSFYGSEDLTPMDFYKVDDAKLAMEQATWVVQTLLKFIV